MRDPFAVGKRWFVRDGKRDFRKIYEDIRVLLEMKRDVVDKRSQEARRGEKVEIDRPSTHYFAKEHWSRVSRRTQHNSRTHRSD